MSSPERVLVAAGEKADVIAKAALNAAPVGLLVIDDWGKVLSVNQRFLNAANPSGRAGAPATVSDFEVEMEVPVEPAEHAFTPGVRLIWSAIASGGWVGALVETADAEDLPTLGTDTLTGLLNRQALQERHESLAKHGCVHALFIDLDRFKQVNDTLGHETGDALLRSVARRIESCVRDERAVARVGGDEFVALISGLTENEDVHSIADRVIEKLSRPFLINSMQVLIGASIGISRCHGGGIDELLRHADVALYESKRLGRGRATWYTPAMMASLEDRRALEQALRKALLLEEFAMCFQPQYSFDSNAITGFEALVRWHRPTGIVQPADFISVAEETGLMVNIGSHVLDMACREASQWPEHLTVAVNVSPVQFMDDGFVATVEAALKKWNLSPARLELELTENLLLKEEAVVEARMLALQKLGVSLSLDDFGTGYASLRYLRRFPFNKIKIDQSFVREPLADESAQKIAHAVAGLGANLGLHVVAEGVESQAQLDRLHAQGVTAVQGFLLSEPIAAEEVAGFMENWTRKDLFEKEQL